MLYTYDFIIMKNTTLPPRVCTHVIICISIKKSKLICTKSLIVFHLIRVTKGDEKHCASQNYLKLLQM